MKVTGTRKDSDAGAETKSEARCVKSALVNPEKNTTGQPNYKRIRRSSSAPKETIETEGHIKRENNKIL